MDMIADMIKKEGIPDRKRHAGLGKYYEYKLYDHPFLQGKKLRGTRYVVPVVNNSGEKAYVVGNTEQDMIDKFKVKHPDGWNERTESFKQMELDLKEKVGMATWLVEQQRDMGDLPSTAYPVAPKPDDPHAYVPPGQPPSTGVDDFWTSIITLFRSIGIK
jgi:hypothetical protein